MMTPDEWLCRAYEYVAYHVEARFPGINNFSLSRYALLPYGAHALLPILEPAMTRLGMFVVFFGLIGVGFGTLNTFMTEKFFIKPGLGNPVRSMTFWVCGRYFFIGTVCGDVLRIGSSLASGAFDPSLLPSFLGNLGFLSHLYFLACNPMPPSFVQEVEAKRGRLATVQT